MLESSAFGSIFALIAWLVFIFQILYYVGYSVWLYLVNKKLWEPYSWISFIPVINIYSFVKASGKDWIWILWLILGFVLFVIPWLIILAILCDGISKRTWGWFWRAAWILFFPFIVLPIVWLNMKEQIQSTIAEKTDIYV